MTQLDLSHELSTNPNFYLRFSKFNLGKHVPEITGMKSPIYGINREDMIIETELTFDCDADIEIELQAGFDFRGRHYEFSIRPGLQWFYMKTKVRLTCGPLFSMLPLIGGITVSLIDQPVVDWRTVGMARIFNLDFLKSGLCRVANCWLQWPARIYINLAKYKPTEAMSLGDPIACIQIELRKANKLQGFDGKVPKPFVSVEFEDQEQWTLAQATTNNPTFNHRMLFYRP